MDEKLAEAVADEAALWSGVVVPNAAAREMTAQLDAVIKGFEALRGAMAFEMSLFCSTWSGLASISIVISGLGNRLQRATLAD